ncbi:hypothetical protein IRJ41_020631 [Triplophysa rosa]|uniref:Gypsy retrotransposon integrase-like protein 1 n=1 Tax=Triplophysa rosa TaxID=992332 RepID=A0A9W8CAI6_TRIRA|nr:hypothetical protein IRJ41_020631 [Triplophysa rosa]
MSMIGSFATFDSNVEDWGTYVERVELYCKANEVADEKKVSVLLSVMGVKTYGLLRSLLTPEKPADKTFKEIVDILHEHLNPKPLVIAERSRFHKRNQAKVESISEYMAELRRLSEHCQFGAGLTDALRDRLVCGMHNESTQKRLLTEKDLTLERALNIAVSMETDKDCRKCHKKGNIERVCKTAKWKTHKDRTHKVKRKATNVHQVTENETNTSSDSDDLSCLELYSINETDRRVIWLTPEVSGVKLKMELDTGSALSVISTADYKKLFPELPLQKTSVILKTYTGKKVSPKGKLKVDVKYNENTQQLDLYVLETEGPALFGRECLRKIPLDWHAIKSLNMSSHVTSKDAQKTLAQILENAAPVFQKGIGTLKGIKARLELKRDISPKFLKARSVSYALRPKVEAELGNLEKTGILTKVDRNKAGSVHICGDFKATINPVLHTVQYPLPRIEDIFASLSGGECFTKLDLAQAYLQMEMEDSSKKVLTINTQKGLYQYNRLVFGIASAPALWQKAMDQVLQDVPGTQCYLDDIIVTGKDDTEHLQNLQQVLTRLSEYGLRANKEKCEFFKKQISYCGHVIDKDGLHKSQDKLEAVLNAPCPQNVSQLRSYLGLVNYYHKFLPNLSTVLHPLNALLQTKTQWKWTDSSEQAFKETKRLITSDVVLAHFNPSVPIRLACDASPYGIGAVLEALSLVWGLKKFHRYLYGQRFTLVTDHQPLVSIFNCRKGVSAMASARLQRWSHFLGAHQYDIEYKSTKLHCNADGLSRLPLQMTQSSDTMDPADLPVTNALIQKETRNDATLSKIYEITVRGWPKHGNSLYPAFSSRRDQLSVCRGTLMCGLRVVIPSKLCRKMLDNLNEGHLGTVKMKNLARSYMWWPGIDKQIEDLTKACSGCQKVQNSPPLAALHPWEWPSTPWQRVHIDFSGPFKDPMFLIAVDAHSKWPEVLPMKTTTSEKTVSFMKQHGIKHITSAPYHPAMNGLVERFVQTFKKAMKAMDNDNIPLQHKIDNVLFMYRNAVHATTGQPPAMIFFKRNLRSRLDLIKPNVRWYVENKQFASIKDRPTKTFRVGQEVLARDYRMEKWQPGTIVTRTGPLSYAVKVGEATWRRHAEQLVDCQVKSASSPVSDSNKKEDDVVDVVSSAPVEGNDSDHRVSTAEVTNSVVSEPQISSQRRYPERCRKPPQRFDL